MPDNRRGHGIPIGVVVEELKAAGFEIVSEDTAWRNDLYAVVARNPGRGVPLVGALRKSRLPTCGRPSQGVKGGHEGHPYKARFPGRRPANAAAPQAVKISSRGLIRKRCLP